MNFQEHSDSELVEAYGSLVRELRRRKIIRSKNVVGDLGEKIAIDHYNKTPGLPNLQAALAGSQSVDAMSRKGERYTKKTVTGKVTGVFRGLPPQGSQEKPQQSFEYVIIVQLTEDYTVKGIYELTWVQMLQFKKWHSRMSAWNLPLNKEVISASRMIMESKG